MLLKRAAACVMVAAIGVVVAPTAVSAGPGGGGGSRPTPPAQTGVITVEHRDGAGTSTTTNIPSGSAFRTQGGGDRVPCQFTYFAADEDGNIDLDAEPQVVDSPKWVFRETTDSSIDLSDEEWEGLGDLGNRSAAETIDQYGAVDTAFRRFNVYCAGRQGSGTESNQFLNSITVSINDPFFGYRGIVDQLRTQIPWPAVDSASLPERSTFGGLPVNMPTNFQINSSAWGSFLSPSAPMRGWTTQLVVTAADVDFDVVFDPDDGPVVSVDVGCVSNFGDVSGSGWIPARGSDVPDFAEPGQYAAPCVWIPPAPGEVTVTAQVTYQVRSVVSGPGGVFRENLASETRPSPSMQLRVDELSVVNLQPGGGGN